MKSLALILITSCLLISSLPAADSPVARVSFHQQPGSLQIKIDEKPFATYVWNDPKILRPYFAHIHAPNGQQVSRRLPPVEGQDATDHADMHPGLWLAFGDLAGADFWRNKGRVQHIEFIDEPTVTNDSGRFSVRNRYVAVEKTICEEVCRIRIRLHDSGYLINWTSEFSGPDELSFGDQEEMGLGIRLATPLTVKNGGQIVNSDGFKNEKGVWGKQADWCDYSGAIDGQQVGIALLPDPRNFRRCWFHARDYGLLVANPFGQNAFTKGEKSRIVIKQSEKFQLRFGVLVHSGNVDLASSFQKWKDSTP